MYGLTLRLWSTKTLDLISFSDAWGPGQASPLDSHFTFSNTDPAIQREDIREHFQGLAEGTAEGTV